MLYYICITIYMLYYLLCYNYYLVIAPVTLGMTPVTLLGLVSSGWRWAYQKCHGGL